MLSCHSEKRFCDGTCAPYPRAGAEDDEWDDEWDDVKSTSGYAESEAGDAGAMQRGGVHATSMKISLNK